MTPPLPTRDVLKSQAKRLRAHMAAQGHAISHAQALETIARQWGMRDWNTLSASSMTAPTGWMPGQRVSGRYLGHPFVGAVKAARLSSSGYWSLTIRFDTPIDVVTSDLFSSFRRQINATVNPSGQSPQKTSNGQPHLMLDPA